MADIVGVVFHNGIKVYHFDPAGLELSRGDRVVVQTISGPEIGQVVEPPHSVEDSELSAPLKKVVRVATGKDLETEAASEDLRRQAMDTCRQLIEQHGLDMKLVDAVIGFGGEKITFSFFSEERVDFRALVADLAKTLKMRIELRQVGAREEARMVGGLGPCGRGLCCTMFPGDDDPVSIRMAKEQNLPLNPMKISGLCGRLMCCLKYEQDQYVRFRKEAPAKGTSVCTLSGQGVVAGYNCTKEAITVRLQEGGMTEVRLCACQAQEDGSLLVIPETPEVEEPVPTLSWLDSPAGIQTLVAADDEGPDALPVVEAEVILGVGGEPVEVIVAETSRRHGRRGRGHRRGRGRVEGGEAAATGRPAAATGASAGPGDSGGSARGGQRGAGHGRQQRGPEAAGSGGETPGPGSGGRSRRRRRSRRPGGDGTPGGGSPGDAGGSSPGGSGAGAGGGNPGQ